MTMNKIKSFFAKWEKDTLSQDEKLSLDDFMELL